MLDTTLKVPGVGFSVVGLDRSKFGFYGVQSFLLIVVTVISIIDFTKNYVLTNFNS